MLNSLTKEQLIDLIKTEFAGVTRDGGVSWSEGSVIDDYGTKEERAAARAKDKDQSWMQVAEDPDWKPNGNGSQWYFLDSIGFRYYFVAAMMRSLTLGLDNLPVWRFNSIGGQWFMNASELSTVAEYVRFRAELPTLNALLAVLDEADMAYEDYLASGETWTPELIWSEWLEPLETKWRQYLPKTP